MVLKAVTIIGEPDDLARTAGSAQVLDADTLRASRVFTTSEALRKLPGVSVRDEEGFGLRPNIGIRGLNPTRSTKVLLLEDGDFIDLYDPEVMGHVIGVCDRLER